jgi:hypothetical protein
MRRALGALLALGWLGCWLSPARCCAQPTAAKNVAAFSFGAALGYAHFSRAESEVRDASSPARDALRLTLPCQLSVGAAGLELSPGIAFGDLTTLSFYVGPNLELALPAGLALRFGAGLWYGRNLSGGVYSAGSDIYGRIPISLGYRAARRFGLFASVAIAFGASQVATAQGQREFQSATAFDAAVGVWL